MLLLLSWLVVAFTFAADTTYVDTAYLLGVYVVALATRSIIMCARPPTLSFGRQFPHGHDSKGRVVVVSWRNGSHATF
jgi:membrane-associated PAP2 superfamily phosphatase